MGQHYTRHTVETSAWCNKCGKNTPHRVADKRLQYCIPCYEESAVKSATERCTVEMKRSVTAVQGRLF